MGIMQLGLEMGTMQLGLEMGIMQLGLEMGIMQLGLEMGIMQLGLEVGIMQLGLEIGIFFCTYQIFENEKNFREKGFVYKKRWTNEMVCSEKSKKLSFFKNEQKTNALKTFEQT